MLEIKSIHTVSDFIPLRLAWEALYAADPEAHVFLSWQWLLGIFESRHGEWLILLASTDAEELVDACDRVVVLSQGRQVGELSGRELTEKNLLRMATDG